MNRCNRFSTDAGFVLLVAMLMAAMMATLTASALRVVGLETRMAANGNSRLLAYELADSVLVHVLHNPNSFPLLSAVGPVPCPRDDSQYTCTPELQGISGEASYTVTRLDPEMLSNFPVRELESRVSGTGHFQTAIFEVAVTVGRPGSREGFVKTIQGVAIRVPSPAK